MTKTQQSQWFSSNYLNGLSAQQWVLWAKRLNQKANRKQNRKNNSYTHPPEIFPKTAKSAKTTKTPRTTTHPEPGNSAPAWAHFRARA